MKKILRRIWIGLGVLLLLFLVALFFIQSPWGKSLIAKELSKRLSDPGRMEVHIGTIRGWIPTHIQISRIDISDAKGLWLVAQDVELRPKFRDLMKGRIRLEYLHAKSANIRRLPTQTTEHDQSGKLQQIDVRVESLSADRIHLGKAVAGTPLVYSISSGRLQLNEGTLSGTLMIDGDATGRFYVNALLEPPESRTLTVRTDAAELHRPNLGMERIVGFGSVRVDALGVEASFNAQIEKDNVVRKLNAALRYTGKTLQIEEMQLNSEGAVLTGKGSLDFSEDQIAAEFDGQFTDAKTNQYRITGESDIVVDNASWSAKIDTLTIEQPNGITLHADGSVDAESVNVQGAFNLPALNQLPYAEMTEYKGRAHATFRLSGPLDEPEASAKIALVGLGKTNTTWPPIDLQVEATLTNHTLTASTARDDFHGGAFEIEASAPCQLSLVPFKFNVNTERLSGALKAQFNMASLNQMDTLANQRISGLISADLRLIEGDLYGSAEIKQAAYEHYEWGIVFQDLNAEMRAEPDGLIFQKATATDGHKGGLFLSGGLRGTEWDVALELRQAQVLRRPEVNATISGLLALKGELLRPMLSGKLTLDRADILPSNMPPAKPRVLSDYDATTPKTMSSVKPKELKLPIDVNVRIELPGQIFVNADLIDSVWGGELQIQNVTAGWKIEGRVEPKHGFIDFVGKPFRFKSGALVFDGAIPCVPTFNNLTAEYSRSDISARLILNGTLTQPNYRLESTPPLPEDEILAQVLYKRGSGSISAWQALQIAQTIRQLSGDISGPGFIYQLRRSVGVDTFEVRESDGTLDSSSLVAGKYLAPGFYVEVSGKLRSDAHAEVRVEYEISKHLSIETTAGPALRPGIMLNWKFDY